MKGLFALPLLPDEIDFLVNSILEGTVQNTAPTGVNLVDTDDNPLTPVSINQIGNIFEIKVPSGSPVPAQIQINGVNFKTVDPADTLNILVRNSDNVDVGTPDSLNNRVNIADSSISIRKSDGNQIALIDIPAEDLDLYNVSDSVVSNSDSSYTANVKATDPLSLPDQTIEVNGVNEGAIPSVGTIDIDITDGVNPVTPNNVVVSGRNVTVEVPTGDAPKEQVYAYGLRKLVPSYTGDCAVVRRDSDDTTTDIGFIGNAFDAAAFDTFVGAGNGFCRNLYNQADSIFSGAFGSTTLANQPQIVDKGSRKVLEGRGALNANVQLTSGNQNIISTFQNNLGLVDDKESGFTISYVIENVNANLSNYLLYSGSPLSLFRFSNINTLGLQTSYTSTNSTNVGSPTNLRHILLVCNSDRTYTIYVDNVSVATGTMNNAFFTIRTCILSGGAQMAEWQAWNRAITDTERNSLWAEIETYYGL